MADDEVRNNLASRVKSAQADRLVASAAFQRAMDAVYMDPELAALRMGKVSREEGFNGLLARLEKNPGQFGQRRGSLLSPEGVTLGGGAKRARAAEEMQKLVGLVRSVSDATRAEKDAEKALGIYDSGGWKPKGEEGRRKGWLDLMRGKGRKKDRGEPER